MCKKLFISSVILLLSVAWVYNEAGKAMNEVHLRLLPLQRVSINSLGLKTVFGKAETYPSLGNSSLLAALSFHGGRGGPLS